MTRWPEAYHESKKLATKEVLVDRFRRSLLRLRFLHDDVTIEQLHSDQYYEFGDFVDGNFRVTSTEKDGKTAIIEMERMGSIRDLDSDDRTPVRITKDIYLEDNEMKVSIRVIINEIPEKEQALNQIVKNLNLAIDFPFFFNGDTNKFQWQSKSIDPESDIENKLLEPFEYTGFNFKAYDEPYDLNFEIDISNKDKLIKIKKFPIIAYTYTEQGYKEIYQGICVVPIFKLEKNLEIHLTLKIF